MRKSSGKKRFSKELSDSGVSFAIVEVRRCYEGQLFLNEQEYCF